MRPRVPLSLEDARRQVAEWIQYYNEVRLHSAIGYITPRDRLEGRHQIIFAERDRKLDAARLQRAEVRKQLREQTARCAEKPRDEKSVSPQLDFVALRATLKISDVLALLGCAPSSQRGKH